MNGEINIRFGDIQIYTEVCGLGFQGILESDVFVATGKLSKLECIDKLIIMLAERISEAKAVKDRLEREFMVEFERSKK